MPSTTLVALILAAGLAQPAPSAPATGSTPPTPAAKLDAAAPDTTGSPRVEVVFVLDTTGSMGGLIDGAQKKIWSIANAIATCKPAPKLKVGLVAYRDRGDAYITQVTQLTDDLDTLYTKLMALKAEGGGDGPESVNQALNEAVTKIEWTKMSDPLSSSTLRIIYLVGDAPPHMDYKDDVKHDASCIEAMKRGLVINTIQCGSDGVTLPIWQTIAHASEGSYFQIAQAGGVVAISTPHDESLVKLNGELEKTMLTYGDSSVQRDMEMKRTMQAGLSDAAASPAAPASTKAAAADRAVYNLSSAGASNLYGRQELVADVTADKVKLAEIKKEDLPDQLKTMTLEEREAFVKSQAELRKGIVEQITALAAKRDAFIKAQLAMQTGKTDSFDDSVLTAFRKQAAAKGVRFEEKKQPEPLLPVPPPAMPTPPKPTK